MQGAWCASARHLDLGALGNRLQQLGTRRALDDVLAGASKNRHCLRVGLELVTFALEGREVRVIGLGNEFVSNADREVGAILRLCRAHLAFPEVQRRVPRHLDAHVAEREDRIAVSGGTRDTAHRLPTEGELGVEQR